MASHGHPTQAGFHIFPSVNRTNVTHATAYHLGLEKGSPPLDPRFGHIFIVIVEVAVKQGLVLPSVLYLYLRQKE